MKAHARKDLDSAGFDRTAFARRNRISNRVLPERPILRTKRRGFLRNVCVALGNIGDESALPALEKAARDSEPLIAEHARWAISRN